MSVRANIGRQHFEPDPDAGVVRSDITAEQQPGADQQHEGHAVEAGKTEVSRDRHVLAAVDAEPREETIHLLDYTFPCLRI